MDPSLATKIRAANAAILADGDLGAIERFFAPEYVAHATETELSGHDGIRRFLGLVRRAFPDLEFELEVLVEGKDRIAWQRTLRGTQEGDFLGFPATGRRVVWRDMVTSRFEDGRIAEEWVITDLAERLLRARKK
jgi:steroid delta-isomerase-like uncharacterized protein